MAISISTLFMLFLISLAKPNTILNNAINSRLILCIIVGIISVGIISRDYTTGDTGEYVESFLSLATIDFYTAITSSGDPLFLTTQWLIAQTTNSIHLFLAIMWAIFVTLFLKFMNKFLSPNQSLIVFFSFTLFPFFYTFTANIIRQGLALALLLLVVSYYMTGESKNRKTAILLVCSCLCHWSAVPFAIILLLIKRYDFSLRSVLLVWCFSAACFLAKIQEVLMSPFLPYIPKIDSYRSASTEQLYGSSGYRLDFFLFSLLWIILAVFAHRFFSTDTKYSALLKVYILFNTVFLLLGFIPFSDRIASYSWMLIPLLIWLPVFNARKHQRTMTTVCLLVFVLTGLVTGTFSYYKFL